ncbi:MAG: RHS repeat-associated core domain-containing protein, partial [Terracidiphilus sp.]
YIYLNGRPVAVLNGSALYFLQDDLLGTPQSATDNEQNTQWQASHEPFGQTTSVSGTITQNLRFPGQYFDVESGWNHNGFRDYLPALGRYAEPDPIGRLGSGNDLYVYVGNNPVNFADPLGLCAAMISAQDNKQVCSTGGDPGVLPGSLSVVANAEATYGGPGSGQGVSYQPTAGAFQSFNNLSDYDTFTSNTTHTYVAGGAFVGVGVGPMISNANNVSQLQLTNSTTTISTPVVSVSWSTGGGIWELQATFGPGLVFGYSKTSNKTTVESNSLPCPTY